MSFDIGLFRGLLSLLRRALTRRPWSDRKSDGGHHDVISVLIRARQSGGRHESRAEFANDLFPELRIFGGGFGRGGLERYFTGFELGIVAPGAIAVDDRAGLGRSAEDR
jgi:hypothetical protein